MRKLQTSDIRGYKLNDRNSSYMKFCVEVGANGPITMDHIVGRLEERLIENEPEETRSVTEVSYIASPDEGVPTFRVHVVMVTEQVTENNLSLVESWVAQETQGRDASVIYGDYEKMTSVWAYPVNR